MEDVLYRPALLIPEPPAYGVDDVESRFSQPDFGNAESEYKAARESAAIFDVSNRTQLEMSGADRHSFFHGFCTNDIKGLAVGGGCEAFLCNVKGRILGHVFVFAGEDSLWIESVPEQGNALTAHLNKYHLVEDIELTERTDTVAEYLISGPLAAERLGIAGLKVAEIACWRHVAIPFQVDGTSITCHVKRVDIFGTSGFLITAPSEHADALWLHFTGSGIDPAGTRVLDSLRVEAEFPVYGLDLTDENLAQEASRTEQAISFQKGCYLGQEPIARLNAMGHVNKALKSFVFDTTEAIPAGTVLMNPKNEGKEAGRATSVAWSWALGKPIGMGMVRSLFHAAGTEVPAASERRTMAIIR